MGGGYHPGGRRFLDSAFEGLCGCVFVVLFDATLHGGFTWGGAARAIVFFFFWELGKSLYRLFKRR